MLITSISGIRGTIGGVSRENLTPIDIVEFISAYGTWLQLNHPEDTTVVVGRDGRASGAMIMSLTIQTLVGLGINVVNADYATTPTVEMEVTRSQAQGGIIITASHNPKEYNGIKMLNEKGEFLSAQDGSEILKTKKHGNYNYSDIDNLGSETKSYNHTKNHIEDILNLELINTEIIKSKKYTICVDAINSVGGIAVPMLLEKFGAEVIGLHCEIDGQFSHAPEPLEKNLSELKALVVKTGADFGIAVDPDVDRLVLVDEKGEMFGEEYTIVAAADYVLSKNPGATVSNLSSSRALRDVTDGYNMDYFPSLVGEKNVVEKMKEVNAVIGGEGSGGVIYPQLHYGRDALVGIALILSHVAEQEVTLSELKTRYTNYVMAKEKIDLHDRDQIDMILETLQKEFHEENCTTIDGLKIDFDDSWIHIRASNTEPILRIYTEAYSLKQAEELAHMFIEKIKKILS